MGLPTRGIPLNIPVTGVSHIGNSRLFISYSIVSCPIGHSHSSCTIFKKLSGSYQPKLRQRIGPPDAMIFHTRKGAISYGRLFRPHSSPAVQFDSEIELEVFKIPYFAVLIYLFTQASLSTISSITASKLTHFTSSERLWPTKIGVFV